jgi:hypothetical protein
MGTNFATDLASMDNLTMQRQIEIHLTGNFYPPIPAFMAKACVQSIQAYWEDDTDRYISMPEGVFYKGMSHAPAWAIVEQHKLHPWIESDDEE